MKIMIIDDEDQMEENFKNVSSMMEGIEIEYFKYSSDGFEALEKKFYSYSGIILDARGFREPDSEKATDSHIHEALEKLSEFEKLRYYIPKVIYTGHHEVISTQLDYKKELIILDKGFHSPKEVIDKIIYLSENSSKSKSEKKYPIVFEVANKYFTQTNIGLLHCILSCDSIHSEKYVDKKKNFDNLRLLNEALVDLIPFKFYTPSLTINQFVNKINDESTRGNVANRGNRSSSFIKYINYSRSFDLPSHVFHNILSIYETASSYFSHSTEESDKIYPDSTIFNSLLTGHLSNYTWFNEKIKSRR